MPCRMPPPSQGIRMSNLDLQSGLAARRDNVRSRLSRAFQRLFRTVRFAEAYLEVMRLDERLLCDLGLEPLELIEATRRRPRDRPVAQALLRAPIRAVTSISTFMAGSISWAITMVAAGRIPANTGPTASTTSSTNARSAT